MTADLPGTGGTLRAKPSHFVVEEVPLYEPSGEGDHVYVTLRREGQNTRDVQKSLARLFGLEERDIGAAGLKDKFARTTQTFSILLRDADLDTVTGKIQGELDVEVLSVSRHRNKLKTGHLLGNRFWITITEAGEGAVDRAKAIVEALQGTGLPNFYGEQRFGNDGANALRGKELLFGRIRRKPWLRRFLLSAYQSALFNLWLARRLEAGLFSEILEGDVAKKTETGGLFLVQDEAAEQARFKSGEITYTGPMYGSKLRRAEGRPGEMEQEVLNAEGVTSEMLKRARLPGARRVANLRIGKVGLRETEEGLEISFYLPKGAYATALLREVMKSP